MLAEETPVALVYNGISHAVMMASPADLEDFALGFSVSEGIADDKADIGEIETVAVTDGIEVRIELSSRAFWRLRNGGALSPAAPAAACAGSTAWSRRCG